MKNCEIQKMEAGGEKFPYKSSEQKPEDFEALRMPNR